MIENNSLPALLNCSAGREFFCPIDTDGCDRNGEKAERNTR